MSRLSQYLKKTGCTQAEFARLVQVNQATVSKICRGVVGVSLATAVRIEQATGGEVPASSLLQLSSPSDASLREAS